ncbi:MAG: hypothetical protein ACRD2J_05265, partial [Thermoanaerobaculia bacterium]
MKRLLLALPLLALFAQSSPAADTLLSSPTIGAADYFGSHLIAAGGDGYLVVFHAAELEAFFGVRLDASGTPLDARPFLLLADAPMRFTASLAWRGDRWALVWENRGDLHYAEISSAGEVVARHSPWVVGLYAPRLAWNGASLVLAASEARGFRYALHTLAVGDGGSVLTDQVVWNSYFLSYDLAAAGSQFGLAIGGSGHTLVRLAPQGGALGSTALTPASVPAGELTIAGLGDGFHVAVVRDSGGEVLHHVVVNAAGVVTSDREVLRAEGSVSGIRVDLAASATHVVGVFGGASIDSSAGGVAAGAWVADAAGAVLETQPPRPDLDLPAVAATPAHAVALAV